MTEIIKTAPNTYNEYVHLFLAFKLLFDRAPVVSAHGYWMEVGSSDPVFLTHGWSEIESVKSHKGQAVFIMKECDGESGVAIVPDLEHATQIKLS